jgi:hypothetical protein
MAMIATIAAARIVLGQSTRTSGVCSGMILLSVARHQAGQHVLSLATPHGANGLRGMVTTSSSDGSASTVSTVPGTTGETQGLRETLLRYRETGDDGAGCAHYGGGERRGKEET